MANVNNPKGAAITGALVSSNFTQLTNDYIIPASDA